MPSNDQVVAGDACEEGQEAERGSRDGGRRDDVPLNVEEPYSDEEGEWQDFEGCNEGLEFSAGPRRFADGYT